jgi:hypothetical protein
MNLLEASVVFIVGLLVLYYFGIICISGCSWCSSCSERFTNSQTLSILAAAKVYYDSNLIGGPDVTMNPISIVREIVPDYLYEIKYTKIYPIHKPWAETQETARFAFNGNGKCINLVQLMRFS